MNIQFKEYKIIDEIGILLVFNINGKEYTRCSLVDKLLWWKENGRYLDENEVLEIEPVVRDLFHDKIKEFKDLPLTNLVPCDHSDWVRHEDEDHAILTQCQKCGEIWRK